MTGFKLLKSLPEGVELNGPSLEVLQEIERRWRQYDVIVVNAPVACHGKGERIRMHDGSSSAIEDISIGDNVMGPDGLPRIVQETFTGVDDLYKISAHRFGNYIMTGNHLLALKKITKSRKKGYYTKEIVKSVEDCYNASNDFKINSFMYTSSVEYPEVELKVDPYRLGIWLGDGHTNSMDQEVVSEWISWGTDIRVAAKPENPVMEELRSLGVFDNKHIPRHYIVNSRENRLKLLAGIIDTDGYCPGSGIEVTQKIKSISESIQEIALSLGFCASLTIKYVNEVPYYRVYISGHGLESIPCRVERRKPTSSLRNLSNRKFKIESIGKGEFYGIRVDKDNLYLLEDYTVTHNCGKSGMALALANYFGGRILNPTNVLSRQYESVAKSMGFPLKGVYSSGQYTCKNDDKSSCRQAKGAQKRYCLGCPYLAELREAKRARQTVSTYHMCNALGMQRLPIIADEAHNLIRFVQDQHQKLVWPHKCGVPIEYLDNIKTLKDYISTHDTSATPLDLVAEDLFVEKGKYPEYVYEITQELWSGGGTVYGQKYERGTPELAPVIRGYPLDIRGQLKLGNPAAKLVLMSATINASDIRQLGLDEKRVLYLEAKSAIPPDRRPIITDYVGGINRKNQVSMVDKIVKKIHHYLETRPEKGMIHMTYSMADELRRRLDHPRLIFHTKANTSQKLAQFKQSSNGVFVGCGLYEGVSLDYDQARWQVIAKVPFPSLASPLHKYHSEKDPDFYAWSTLKNLIQAYGRVCRRPDDLGDTYILDSNFGTLLAHNKHLVPEWFTEAIKGGQAE